MYNEQEIAELLTVMNERVKEVVSNYEVLSSTSYSGNNSIITPKNTTTTVVESLKKVKARLEQEKLDAETALQEITQKIEQFNTDLLEVMGEAEESIP